MLKQKYPALYKRMYPHIVRVHMHKPGRVLKINPLIAMCDMIVANSQSVSG